MKKLKKKILAFLLAITCVMPNSMYVSAASNKTTVDIVAEDTEAVTTEVNKEFSGEVTGKEEVKTVTYTATSELTDGEAYVEEAEATVTRNDWSIDDLTLMPGENTITVTATTESGNTATEVIEIEYDIGEVAEIEDTLETEEGLVYSDNQLLVMFQSGVSEERAEEIIASVGGKVIGNIYVLDEYQIEVEATDYEGLAAISKKLESYDEVILAELNTVMETDMAVPNDPWGGSQDWDEENPSGRNWGVEAIQAPSAWEYNDLLSECVVGVVDNGFQTDHPDVEINFASDYIKEFNSEFDHGTHVAGTIGATSNNGIGVTGINCKAKIYGGSCSNAGATTLSSSKINYNIAELVQSGAKVLNGSFGSAASSPKTDASVLSSGRSAAAQMAKLLAAGYDFIFVQAAGNSNCDARYNGRFCSIEENTPVSVEGITIQDILNRKIVVANASNLGNGTYQLSNSSCWGKNVDIAAPGNLIYSTTINSDYTYKSGTSMAAPHVTGVVSLVWSADPDLTGPQVKEIVVNSTCDTVASVNADDPVSEYKMLNAKLSVEKALQVGQLTVSTSNPVSIIDTSNVTLTYATEDATKYSYRFGTILNGQEYVLSDGYQTENRLQVSLLTAISGNSVADASAVGTHTLFVDVKDGNGKVVRKTIENYVVEGLKITSFEADKASPQTKGTEIKLNAVVENEGAYRYNIYKFSVIKDGVETNLSPYVPVKYSVTWTPKEAGTYTLKYYIKDYLGQEATKTMEYHIVEEEQQQAVVYYSTSWSQAYIHYKTGDGTWTTVPGVKMEADSTQSGYQWKYVIDLEDADEATVCFNNGSGTWDSRNGNNYSVGAGTYGIKDGSVKQLTISPTVTPTVIPTTAPTATPAVTTTPTPTVAPIENATKVYYTNDSWSQAYIHYKTNDGQWTTVPGIKMEENISANGYTWKYVIDLEGADGATVCFNNGNGSWDSQNGANYNLEAGAYGIKNGAVEKLQEGLMVSLSADREVGGTYNPTTFIAAAENGTAPYTYKFAIMTAGSKPTDASYVTGKADGTYSYTPYSAKDYTVFVKVTDAEGNTAETSMNYTVEGQQWGKFTATAENHKVGTPVTLEAEYINYKQDSYNNYSFIVEKDGVSNTYSTGTTGYYVWTPTEEGIYTITAKFSAYTGAVYTTELTYEVKNGNTATIYYNSSWPNAYIHYCVAGESWSAAPGVAMTKTSEKSGYTYKYVIDLDDAESVTVCFNNGNGSWDSNNGNNYTIKAGTYGVSNGNISEVK